MTGEIAVEALRKFPQAATMTLAKKIYKENPQVFNSIEHARTTLRTYAGENGKRHKSKSIFEGKREKVTMPETWAKPKEVFIMPTGYNNIGIISDLQIPFQDNDAVDIACNYLSEKKINCLFINGDFVDFYRLSNFQKDPRLRDMEAERQDAVQMLTWLRQRFPKIPIYYYVEANHELRLENYMKVKAPELYSMNLYKIEDILEFNKNNIICLRGYDHCKIGKLSIIHGHTVFKSWGSVNPAKTVFDKLKQTALVGHCHKKAEYTWTTLNGETHSTWTTGCLMNLNVEYNPHGNNYVHGFARVVVHKDGMFEVENKMIVNGKVV